MWESGGELAGTVVTSDNPVFVTSGAKRSTVTSSAGSNTLFDQLVAYLPPADSVGSTYLVAPLARRNPGEVLRILSELKELGIA